MADKSGDMPNDKSADKQPENPQGEYFNLKVKSQDGEEVFFKIKKTTAFKKLMDAFCSRQQLNPQNVRFLFDGDRITETQTPEQLGMENGDEIDVVIEQVGGTKFMQNAKKHKFKIQSINQELNKA